MTELVLPKLDQVGDNEWADVQDNLLAIRSIVNGGIDNSNLTGAAGITADNLDPALRQQIGAGNKLRGMQFVPGPETLAAPAAFAMMGTPDRIAGLEVPEKAIIAVHFDAKVKSSVANAGRAAIFLKENQLKARQRNSANSEFQGAPTRKGFADSYVAITATSFGLVAGATSATLGSDATTGQALGIPFDSATEGSGMRYEMGNVTMFESLSGSASGLCLIKAAPGLYDISVRYKASSGSVTAAERLLVVYIQAF